MSDCRFEPEMNPPSPTLTLAHIALTFDRCAAVARPGLVSYALVSASSAAGLLACADRARDQSRAVVRPCAHTRRQALGWRSSGGDRGLACERPHFRARSRRSSRRPLPDLHGDGSNRQRHRADRTCFAGSICRSDHRSLRRAGCCAGFHAARRISIARTASFLTSLLRPIAERPR